MALWLRFSVYAAVVVVAVLLQIDGTAATHGSMRPLLIAHRLCRSDAMMSHNACLRGVRDKTFLNCV